MLTTRPSDQIVDVSTSPDEFVATWSAVDLHLGIPYALITYSEDHGSHQSSTTRIMWREDEIFSFLECSHSEKKSVHEISLLLPLDIDGEPGRSLTRVRELWRRSLNRSAEHCAVYITVDNVTICGIEGDNYIPSENEAKLWFVDSRSS